MSAIWTTDDRAGLKICIAAGHGALIETSPGRLDRGTPAVWCYRFLANNNMRQRHRKEPC